MRLTLLVLLAVLGTTVVPTSALAVAPVNDSKDNPAQLAPYYGTSPTPLPILPQAPLGGWDDATSTDDAALPNPTCFGSAGFHSMWYRLDVPESGVVTIGLSSDNVKYYRPLITIIDTAKNVEAACSLGGTALLPGTQVLASSYVATKTSYLIRIASAVDDPTNNNNSPNDNSVQLPGLQLTEMIRDITPPVIRVTVSKTVGVRRAFTFNANGSSDSGSHIDPASALWTFWDGGNPTPVTGLLVLKHAWSSAGLHKVQLQLADMAGNRNTYTFNVLVHSYVPPKVKMRVLAPRRGARSLSIRLTHDMPVRVRLVVLQAGRKLRTILQTIKGFHKTTIFGVRLGGKIAKTGFVIVSGTASDLSNPPNTVPLSTCSVRPGKAGGVCA
jgi:hypothetical protein